MRQRKAILILLSFLIVFIETKVGADESSKDDSEYDSGAVEEEGPQEFDLVVIGGGSGGLACAKEAALYKKKVAVLDFVEPSPRGTTWGIGGTCVNVGCIPKKLFHQGALLGESIEDSRKFGWKVAEGVKHNWTTIVKGVNNYVKSLNFASKQSLNKAEVEYFNARGEFKDKNTLLAIEQDGEKQEIKSKIFVIAVGGRPSYPNDVPGAKEYGITSDDLFTMTKPPGKTLIVGCGYVALECAGFLNGLGYNATVMVRSTCLGSSDRQMADLVTDNLEKKGVRFLKKCNVKSVGKKCEKWFNVTWTDENGKLKSDLYNTVMFAIGRHAVTGPVKLDKIGVAMNSKNGKVLTKNDQTNVPHIYAIGDAVEGTPEFTPVAIMAGKLLARRLYSASKTVGDYSNIATAVFTPLEYGTVGLSEEKAIEKYGADNVEIYQAFYKPLEYTVPGRSYAHCYMKAVTLRKSPQLVLGLHMTGPNAGEVIQGFSAAMKCNLTKELLDQTIGIHPTVAKEMVKLNITKRSGADPANIGC